MKVKVNYARMEQTREVWLQLADELPGKVLPSMRETLEAVLEKHGMIVDKRERLIPQTVIYGTTPELAKLICALDPYVLDFTFQNEYRSKED